jgi:hypothetical protein
MYFDELSLYIVFAALTSLSAMVLKFAEILP